MADQADQFAETKGAALAAFGLSVTTLKFLQQKGTLSQGDVNSIVRSVLNSFSGSDLVSDAEAQQARLYLSEIATHFLNVSLNAPH